MANDALHFDPDWFSPPGDTVADLLEERGWSQAEFAVRTGYTTKHVNQLIRGKATISEDTALRLERVLGSTAGFWLQREAQYREQSARRAEQATLSRESAWLDELPLSDMVRLGWVRDCQGNKAAQVAECLGFFGVATVPAWRERYGAPMAAFHRSLRNDMQPGAVAAWLRQGERRAGAIECASFRRKAFFHALNELRILTNEPDPEIFVPRMTALCAAAGVTVVLEPAPKGCPARGAVRWLTPDTALLMLRLPYESSDQLWFSFFHEAAHLLLHGKRMLFLELENQVESEAEAQADAYAREFLSSRIVAT